MKTLSLITFILLLAFALQAQNPNWGYLHHTSLFDKNFACADSDEEGNFYIVFNYKGADISYYGTTVFNNTTDDFDFFIVKLNPKGKFEWVKGSTYELYGKVCCISVQNGSIFLAGSFNDCQYIAKVNKELELKWSWQSNSNDISAIQWKVSESGRISLLTYINGYLDFTNKKYSFFQSYVVLLFTSTGEEVRAIQTSEDNHFCSSEYNSQSMCMNENDDLYILGFEKDTFLRQTVSKYNYNGELLWKKKFGIQNTCVKHLAIDASGYVVVSGSSCDDSIVIDHKHVLKKSNPPYGGHLFRIWLTEDGSFIDAYISNEKDFSETISVSNSKGDVLHFGSRGNDTFEILGDTFYSPYDKTIFFRIEKNENIDTWMEMYPASNFYYNVDIITDHHGNFIFCGNLPDSIMIENKRVVQNSFSALKLELYHVLSQNQLPSILSVFPVPARDFLSIAIPIETEEDIDLFIYNLEGKCLIQKTYFKYSKQFNLNISELIPGSYIIKIVVGNEVYQKCFLKQ